MCTWRLCHVPLQFRSPSSPLCPLGGWNVSTPEAKLRGKIQSINCALILQTQTLLPQTRTPPFIAQFKHHSPLTLELSLGTSLNQHSNKEYATLFYGSYNSVWFSPGDDVCWYHLQESRVGSPDFPPCVTQPHQTFRNTPGQDGEEKERE